MYLYISISLYVSIYIKHFSIIQKKNWIFKILSLLFPGVIGFIWIEYSPFNWFQFLVVFSVLLQSLCLFLVSSICIYSHALHDNKNYLNARATWKFSLPNLYNFDDVTRLWDLQFSIGVNMFPRLWLAIFPLTYFSL